MPDPGPLAASSANIPTPLSTPQKAAIANTSALLARSRKTVMAEPVERSDVHEDDLSLERGASDLRDFGQRDSGSTYDTNIALLEDRKEGMFYCNHALSSGLICNEESALERTQKNHVLLKHRDDGSSNIDVDTLVTAYVIELERRHTQMKRVGLKDDEDDE